jgi:hypothetical protein
MENSLGSNHSAKIGNKLFIIKKAPTFVDAFLLVVYQTEFSI